MRVLLTNTVFIGALMAFAAATLAQSPPGREGDRPPRPGDAPPRAAPRDDDDRPPPPGKAGPRPRAEAPDQPGPGGRGVPGMSEFQPPGRRGGGMRGGYGGFGGGYGPPMPGMPGGPGMFPGEAADDPEMRELMTQDVTLDRKTHEMAARIREARGEERARLKGELQDIVNKHFDVRQKRRELSLKRMEEEIKRLRDAITDRNKSRDSIVENRVRELTGEPRDLDF